ncbi:MAG: radical SAM protein [Elusimicrobia bacterium]|nr:radical SAM protein [Elusimicrobiota bacterium]
MKPSAGLNLFSLKHKIPLSLTFELTYDCPLSCAHCYLSKKEEGKGKYLNTKEAIKILKMFKKAKTMSVAFTGGEPLLRKDLPEICLAAKALNFDFSLYTSLFPATYSILKRLKDCGLKKLEVSLYGEEKEHEAVTRKKGSYRLVLKNLKLAKKLGFKIKLKTPLTGLNPKGPYLVKKMALKNGFSFSADPLLTPKNDGHELPLHVKAKERDIENLVLSENRGLKEILNQNESETAPLCSAGFNTASVNPYGELFPCLQFPYSFGNLRKKDFFSLWNSRRAENFRKKLYLKPKACLNCDLDKYCSFCPGLGYIKGDLSKINRLTCFIALCSKKARAKRPLVFKNKK